MTSPAAISRRAAHWVHSVTVPAASTVASSPASGAECGSSNVVRPAGQREPGRLAGQPERHRHPGRDRGGGHRERLRAPLRRVRAGGGLDDEGAGACGSQHRLRRWSTEIGFVSLLVAGVRRARRWPGLSGGTGRPGAMVTDPPTRAARRSWTRPPPGRTRTRRPTTCGPGRPAPVAARPAAVRRGVARPGQRRVPDHRALRLRAGDPDQPRRPAVPALRVAGLADRAGRHADPARRPRGRLVAPVLDGDGPPTRSRRCSHCRPGSWSCTWARSTGVRLELATDAVVRTSTAKEVTAGHRLYGIVDRAPALRPGDGRGRPAAAAPTWPPSSPASPG